MRKSLIALALCSAAGFAAAAGDAKVSFQDQQKGMVQSLRAQEVVMRDLANCIEAAKTNAAFEACQASADKALKQTAGAGMSSRDTVGGTAPAPAKAGK